MNVQRQHFTTSGPSESIASPMDIVIQAGALASRHKLLIGGMAALFLALAVAYLLVTPKQFLASAEMIIDPRKSTEFQQQGNAQVITPVDSAVVESQGEILKSENVALSVIRKFDLVNDPTFSQSSGLVALVKAAMAAVISPTPPTAYERERQTIEAFQDRLYVKRVGVTYVFEISFLSPDPQQAAKIANSVADAYVTDDLEAKYNARRRASVWMQDRIKELAAQASDAEHAVVGFKGKNNIVNTGGRLLDEQQIAEITSQLSIARAATSEAKAKLDRIAEVTDGNKLNLSVADALHNEVIIKLRDSYLELAKREADFSSRVGRDHQAPTRLRADMQNLRASISDEVKRIGEGYRSDYQIAKSREEGLSADLDKAVQHGQTTNTAQVSARELESNAQSLRAVYDSFLQRYAESVQQQSFPLTETRVVTSASPPLKKSQPKTLVTLLGALVVGSALGFGLGWLRDSTDRTLRTAAQAEAATDVMHVASIPRIAGRINSVEMFREVIRRPLSAFAESVRELRIMVEVHHSEQSMQAIGFTSALPGEGKSTIASNLAQLLARSKSRVILIDCDMRNPTVSAALAPRATQGLLDVLLNKADIDSVLRTDLETGLDVLPALDARGRSDTSDLLSSPRMRALIDQLKSTYDYVIVDLPPVLSVIDAKAAATMFDGFVFVAEWGSTPSETVSHAIQSSSRLRERMIGVVLNKVAPQALGRQRGYGYGRYLSEAA